MKKLMLATIAFITTCSPLIAEPTFYEHNTPLHCYEAFVIKMCLLDMKRLAAEFEENVEMINFVLENHDKPEFWDNEEIKAKMMGMQ